MVDDTIDIIPNDSLSFLPWGELYYPQYGALVKVVDDPKVYLLLHKSRYWITSEEVFNALSYSWSWIEDISPELLYKYKVAEEIVKTDIHPPYTLVKYANDPRYIVWNHNQTGVIS